MSGLKRAGYIAAVIIILLGIYAIAAPKFSSSDAEQAHGKTYDLNSGWKLTYPDGSSEEIELPYKPQRVQGGRLILENTIPSEYEGLSLRFVVKNATVRVFVDNLPIFTGGNLELIGGGPGGNGQGIMQPVENPMGEGRQPQMPEGENMQPPGNMAEPGEPGAFQNEPVPKEPVSANRGEIGDGVRDLEPDFSDDSESETLSSGSEENIIDLPTSIERGELRIELEAMRRSGNILIQEAGISKRDVAVISQLRSSVPQGVCCIIILLCVAALLMMEIISRIFGWGRYNLAYFACFGIVSIIYCFSGTLILTAFFGNEIFFNAIENLMYIVMPLLILTCHGKKYIKSFDRSVTVLRIICTLIAITQLFLSFIDYVNLGDTEYMSTFWLFVVAVFLIVLERLDKHKRKEKQSIGLIDAAYLSIFVIGLTKAANFALNLSYDFAVLRTVFFALYFIIIVLYFGIVMLTEYRERVEESNRQLVAANEAKGQFLARMSHEIRTPINAVLGMDEMILRETKESKTREYAGDIYTAGNALLSIINDILDLSKIDSGKMEIVPAEYDLCSVINDLVNMISMRAQGKGLKFTTQVDEELPARLIGDDVRIKQILTNILTNAVKYTHEGEVTLRINGERDGEYETLCCEVEDTGIGIKEEDMDRLFSAFERIEESRNRNIEGTGLGMNITMQLLNLMDSELKCESVYGQGSKFYFELKQKIADETPIGDFSLRVKNLADNYHYTSAFAAPEAKILVVDDNATNRKVFKSLLKDTKMQIDEAGGGEECLELVRKKRYDIIFLDHMMPKPDGIETLHLMRSDGQNKCKDTPVFVLTANAIAGAKEKYMEEGFDGFVSKPIIPDKLEQAIRETLPAELMHEAEQGDSTGEAREDDGLHNANDSSGGGTSSYVNLDELPDIDGLDWNFAHLHLPDKELLLDTVKEFYELIDLHADKLNGFFKEMPDAEALNSYRIQVHGMKSAAVTIGIISLGGTAKILEYAARDGEVDIINLLHEIFINEWLSYKSKLEGVFGGYDGEATDADEVDISVAIALLEMIRSAAEEMDMDVMDERVSELLKYKFDGSGSGEVAERLKAIKAAAADLDFDAVSENAKRLIDSL